jgi:hypothetical protein
MTPILAGAGTGALLAAAKGDDPLMGGVMGGMGGYGGAGLGQTFSKAFGNIGGTTAGAMDDLIAAGAQNMGGGAGNIGAFSSFADKISPVASAAAPKVTSLTNQISPFTNKAIGADLGVKNTAPTVGVNAGGYDAAASAAAELAKPPQFMSNLSDFGTGVKNLTGFGDMSVGDAYKKFTDAGGSAMDLAMPIGGGVLAGLEPSDLGYGGGDLYDDPDKGKYRGPQGQLNLSDKYDTGLRLVAKGGAIKSYALGGAVNTNPSVGGGLSSLYNRPEGQAPQNISNDAYGLGRLSDLGSEQARYQAQTLGYADGGDVVAGEKGMNLDQLPTLSVETGKQTLAVDDAYNPTPFDISKYTGYMTPNTEGSLRMAHMFNEAMKANPTPYDESKYTSYMSTPNGPNAARMAHMFSNFKPEAQKAFSNFVSRPRYAQGGYLDGDGDGMSDSIPATIEGKQPARLADGEFVIPADVVSHLGNGSSKAGSKRLYAMLDKVRHARTGNKKQGKQIKADKYLPV